METDGASHCHDCNHYSSIVLPEVSVCVLQGDTVLDAVELAVAPTVLAYDIFTPPKLS